MNWYRRSLYLRLVGLFVAAILIGVTAWRYNTTDISANSASDKSSDSVGANSDNSASPSTTTTTEDQSNHDSTEELQRSIPQLEHFVENTRGLKYKNQVAVNVLQDADFNKKLNSDYQGEPKTLQFRLQALGVLQPEESIDGVLKALDSQNVLGFYDPQSKALYVRGQSVTPGLKVTLVHELTHALQDQYFSLKGTDEFQSDSALAYTALAEGDATYVEEKYYSSLTSQEQAAVDQEQQRGGTESPFSTTPNLITDIAIFPYEAGPDFVSALVDAGGTKKVDQAFVNPPKTTAQIIDPSLYLSNINPESVPSPGASGGAVKETGTLGMEFLTALVSTSASTNPFADQTSADGWVGDSFVSYQRGDAACVSDNVKFDNSSDRDSFASDVSLWVGKQRNASSSKQGDSSLAFTACAPLSLA